VIDSDSPFTTPIHHPVSALVYSALGHETSSVMIGGRFVMRNGRVTSVDERGIRLDAQRRAEALARRAGTAITPAQFP
jgi:5-methylthioadenosine/S-adenosylhomocysteine deaminase